MQSRRLISSVLILFSITIISNIIGCTNSKTQSTQDDSNKISDTVLENLFLSIPTNLTQIEASQLLEDYLRDSLIWNVSNYSYQANNFEQILAKVNFGDVNYRFNTSFIVKMKDSIYEDTDPVVYMILYNRKLLALELEIRKPVILESQL